MGSVARALLRWLRPVLATVALGGLVLWMVQRTESSAHDETCPSRTEHTAPSSGEVASRSIGDSDGVLQSLRRACPHIRSVDVACPRFLYFPIHPRAGIGHRLNEVMFGWRAAQRLNATYVMPPSSSFASKGASDDYVWGYRLLGLEAAETLLYPDLHARHPNLTTVNVCPYMKAASNQTLAALCNVVFVAAGPSYMCCDNGNCFTDPSNALLYESSRPCLTLKRSQGSLFAADAVNVVWHIRVGDALLHQNEPAYFANVLAFLNNSLHGVPVAHVLVFSRSEVPANSSVPSGYEFLIPLFAKTTMALLPTTDPVSAYLAFEAADVLVSTGSSFPEVAMLASTKLGILQGVPKHAVRTYNKRQSVSAMPEFLSDSVYVYREGEISVDAAAFRQHVASKFCNGADSFRRIPLRATLCAPS